MEKHLFLGDEAIAQAAIDAGMSGVYAYPGTPLPKLRNIFKIPLLQSSWVSTATGAQMKNSP